MELSKNVFYIFCGFSFTKQYELIYVWYLVCKTHPFFLSAGHLIGKPFMCRNYWRDCDTALFIMKHLYRGIDEDISKHKTGFPGGLEQKETVDEELPLTFSERSMTRILFQKFKERF